MKSRKEAVELINQQFQKSDNRPYGREQLRELLDFIYGGLPESEEEELTFAATMNLDTDGGLTIAHLEDS